jgi:hypothetical protein
VIAINIVVVAEVEANKNKNKDFVKDHVVQNVNHTKINLKTVIIPLNNHQTLIINLNNTLHHHTLLYQTHINKNKNPNHQTQLNNPQKHCVFNNSHYHYLVNYNKNSQTRASQ